MDPRHSGASAQILRVGLFVATIAFLIWYGIVTYRYAGLLLLIPIIGYLGTRVEYRAFDVLFMFIPIYSWLYILKIVWRACALPFPALANKRASWKPQVIQQVIPMTAQPNWYPDASGQAQFRFFDGYQWTHFMAFGPTPPTAFPMHVPQYVQTIEQRGPQDPTDENSLICGVCHKLQVFKHKHAQVTAPPR